MIKLAVVYDLAGVVFAAFAVLSAGDRHNSRRYGNAAFWGLVSLSFLAGDRLGNLGNGILVLGLALIAGLGGLGRGAPATTSPEERHALAARYGERLFIPALTLPVIVAFGVLVLKPLQLHGGPLLDPKQATLISLALAAVIATAVGLILLRQPWMTPFQEGRRLMDTVGWAALLPQFLAALGAIFALAGVGNVIGRLVTTWIPMDALAVAVAVFCLGMAAFTLIMGNAFAAFPVMMAGIGLPILVHRFGGNPAIVASIGMLSGFCGTLSTPLAANFNLVPAALLDLPDRYAVIKAQVPSAIPILIANMVLMYVLAFPH
ncbi:MAG TPA: DUF979 domain-containing protein [Phenylobacterium sp.]|nr:DUF979 domain-containing protein [Phenylobacterium sp.]